MRVAPRSFVAMLRRVDRRLAVYFEPQKGCWVIAERTRRIHNEGILDGKPFQRIGPRLTRIFYLQGLGSRVIDWLRRLDMSRFRSVEQMVKELEMDSGEPV